MKKRSFILIAIFAMLLALSAITASAKTVDSGYLGRVRWTLDDAGSLVISGKGTMEFPSDGSPWAKNDSIVTVIISNGVTTIGDSAFVNCTSLTSVTIPDSVTTIAERAFYNCKNLSTVTIPDSITSIGSNAFSSCTGLTSVHITDISKWCNIAFTNAKANPLNAAGDLYLNGNLVTHLIIPNRLTSVGNYVFYGCTSLISVDIPNTITSIGDDAFSYCESLTSVTIPDSVTSIGDGAFSWCEGLSSLTIGNNVASIGNSAFLGCSGLSSIVLPDSVLSIGASAFSGCYDLTSVTIPDNVASVGGRAFYSCQSLASVTIPNSINSIGERAFDKCDNLSSVYIKDIAAWCNIKFDNHSSNPLCYAQKLFLNNELVTDLIIPNGVTSISDYAFSGYLNLSNVTFSNSVTSIGEEAFSYCESLASVTIPDSVTSIGDGAFSCCESLSSVTIGHGISLIPVDVFWKCSSLVSVCLPAELQYVKNDAFNGCPNIAVAFFSGSESQWKSILFYNRNENLTNAQIVYNAAKKTYRFVTNCDAALDAVTDYAIFTKPTVKNDSMTLAGWYDNAALSGDPVTFPYYGSASTLYAAWTDRTGNTFEDALIAKADQQYTVTTTTSGQYVYFEFVPKISKMYNFYSIGSKDTYGYLYDSNQSRLTYNDDGDDGINFYISYNLTAGETYYLAVKLRSGTGTFAVFFEEPVDYTINEITIKDTSGNSLSEIPQDDFLATVSFTNVSSNEDVVIVLAQYTEAGAFRGLLYIQSEDIPTGSTLKLSIPVDNSKGNVARLKAFCLASFESMVPIGNAASFPMQ